MKSKLHYVIILLMLSLATIQLNAQSGWQNVLEKPYNNYFTDVWFVAGDDGLWQTGWVIEFHGDIYKTEDGGETWTMYTQTFSERLSTVCFVDENIGYLCTYNRVSDGEEGKILKSTDGGETWVEQISDINYWFSSIRFKDEDNGVVSGTPNMYTSDGGATWTEATPSGDEDYYYGYTDYSSGDNYFAVEIWSGNIGKSEDNGATWTNIHTEEDLLPNYIDFFDGQHGMTGGSNERVCITHDGGESWELFDVDDGAGDASAYGWVDPDTLYASGGGNIFKSIDGGSNWVTDTVISPGRKMDMFVTPTNTVYVLNDIVSGDNSVWRKIGEVPFVADFEADATIICAGSTVEFTDLSYFNIYTWDWTFEGGTPSSSTDQNPSIVYDNTGVYDVSLTVTNLDGDSQTISMTDYITVIDTPLQPEVPIGEENICTESIIYYTTEEVDGASTYEWELSPEEAGTLDWNDEQATLETSNTWTGDFTLRVRAENMCGMGDWSDYFEGTISLSPEIFTLQGGGSYCEGGEGIEVFLDNSQEDINYQLYFDAEPIGDLIAGTGESISFGLQTGAGFYEAVAISESCEQTMSEQVEIVILEMPFPDISGLDMVCDYDISIYETTNNPSSSFTWDVSGGTITDGQGTSIVTIEWGGPGNGNVTVTEEDENGCEGISDLFEVVIDDCTDIDENGLIRLSIYPNPANNKLYISYKSIDNQDSKITIYNHSGQVAFNKEFTANSTVINEEVDISSFSIGLYFIKVQVNNETVITKQLIKK